jgi:AraC-like DNA-binding protein
MRPEQHVTRLFEELSIAEITDSSVIDLAKKFSCSTRHLNRIFHDYFGLSVAALRMELRLLRAASLLRDPDVKVIRVAEQCGFNHLGLFNSCFRRRFAVSPGQYRKQAFEGAKPLGDLPAVNSNCRLQAIGLCPKADGFDKVNGHGETRPASAYPPPAHRGSTRAPCAVEALSCGEGKRPEPGKPVLQLRIQV